MADEEKEEETVEPPVVSAACFCWVLAVVMIERVLGDWGGVKSSISTEPGPLLLQPIELSMLEFELSSTSDFLLWLLLLLILLFVDKIFISLDETVALLLLLLVLGSFNS